MDKAKGAGKNAEFYRSTTITQVSSNGTGYDVCTIFEAEEDTT